MDGSSNNSFIPKRGPANRPKRAQTQKVYIFTIFSYVLFFATLASTAGIFLYSRHIESQFQSEVVKLSDEIGRFNDTDMDKVLTFDERLQKVQARLDASVSLGTLFAAIEKATVKTVQLESLQLERNQDDYYEIVASIKTDNFDSSIFQREMFEQEGIVNSVEISELTITPNTLDESENVDLSVSSEITLTAKLGVNVSDIPFIPEVTSVPLLEVEDVVESQEVSTASSTSVVDTDNQIEL